MLLPMNRLFLLLTLLFTAVASAQTAPEGNAHPQSQDVSQQGRELPNPFGEISRNLPDVPKPDAKHAFAQSLDLTPLRAIPIFHNGRVKVLDTLARETVRKVTGRGAYREDERIDDQVVTRRYTPLFTLLDMTIDPAYYIDKPLIGVEYLPLRERFLEAEFPGDAPAVERWKRLGRITPFMIDRHGRDVAQAAMSDESLRRGLNALDQSVGLFMQGAANFNLLPPASVDLPWTHLSTLPESHPARAAALSLGAAWRTRDAPAANIAIASLSNELGRINPGVFPAWRARLETRYNRANAFEWGYWTYAFSLVALLLAVGTARRWLARLGTCLLLIALLIHAAGFAARGIIAERFAIQNQFESMTGLSLFAVIVGLAVMLLRRQWLFGAASAAVGFMVLITATQTGIPGAAIEREAAILNTSVLLKYHVTTVLSSYGLISLGFILSLFYLGAHYFARPGPALAGSGVAAALGDSRGQIGTRDRLLADLDAAQMVALQLAFWTLGVGILLGAWWADHSWGRWWAFDPKETWALITWIVYLIVIHVRIAAPARKGLTTSWLSVAGFAIMLWTYFGVNLLLPGLHAYA